METTDLVKILKDPILIASIVFWSLNFFAWRKPTEKRLEKLEDEHEKKTQMDAQRTMDISLIRQRMDSILERIDEESKRRY